MFRMRISKQGYPGNYTFKLHSLVHHYLSNVDYRNNLKIATSRVCGGQDQNAAFILAATDTSSWFKDVLRLRMTYLSHPVL